MLVTLGGTGCAARRGGDDAGRDAPGDSDEHELDQHDDRRQQRPSAGIAGSPARSSAKSTSSIITTNRNSTATAPT